MLPIDDMQFTQRIDPDAPGVIVRGQLSQRLEYHIPSYEFRSSPLDLVDQVQRAMKQKLWAQTYGEVKKLATELGRVAIRNARTYSEQQEVETLFNQVLTLLTPPQK